MWRRTLAVHSKVVSKDADSRESRPAGHMDSPCAPASFASETRAGWEESAAQACARGDDALLDPLAATRFDEKEWDW